MVRPHMMSVLDKMIIADLIKTLLSALSVVVVIIVSRKFIKILSKAIDGEVSTQTILSVLGLKTVTTMVSLLPAGAFMAVIIVLGRMYRDQEMSALASASAGLGMIYRSVFMSMIPLCFIAAELSMYTVPWANATIQTLIHDDAQSADMRTVAAGRFSEYKHGDLVVYVENISSDEVMHKVFVQHRKDGKLSIINSESAVMRDLPEGRFMVFQDGERIQGNPGDLDFVIEKFEEYAVRIELPKTSVNLDRESIATARLLETAAIVDIAEIQRRLSIPLGILVLSALAIPLAQVAPRAGIYGNMFAAFLIYFCYMNLGKLSISWVESEAISPWIGYSGVYLLTLMVVCFLLVRLYGRDWIKMKLTGKVML